MASTTEDKRLTAVENEEKAALNENETTYGDMINKSDKYYNDQITASKNWADKQQQLQQEQTDFTIEQIEQQKDQAKQDYTKEQSGAYVDWQKQSNQYGANAESMASAGLANSGFRESSQVSMYNTYQARVTAARESYSRAVLNYDNAIKDARLQNSSVLAEIAYKALQQQLELSLQGFQYKNSLILEKANAKRAIKNQYHAQYMDVLGQINTENAQAFQREQWEWQKAQAAKQSATIGKSSGGSSGGSKGGSSSSKKDNSSSPVDKTESKAPSNKADLRQAAWKTLNTGNVYSKALSFMKENGISDGGQRLLTSAEWSKAKRTGVLGSELEYNSYNDYVRNYVYWRIDES